MAELPSIVLKTRALLNLRRYVVDEVLEYENRYALYPEKLDEGDVLKSVVWIFKEQKVIGVAIVRDIVKEMEETNSIQGMLVGGTRYTPAAKKHARATRVELVEGGYASFDLFGHELVPQHTIAEDSEIDLVLNHYGIKKSQLPRILRDDPAARVLGAKVGQVIRIGRTSPTAGSIYYYRLVVDTLH